MRFTITPKTEPRENDTRTLIKFAWIPVQIGNVFVWLERYRQEERLQKTIDWIPGTRHSFWTLKWKVRSRSLLWSHSAEMRLL